MKKHFRYRIKETNATVLMPDYEDISAVIRADNVFVRKIKDSYNYIVVCLAYMELSRRKQFSDEILAAFFQTDTEYWNYDNSGEDVHGVEAAIEALVTSDEFVNQYRPYLTGITGELINLFCSGMGALATEEAFIYDEDEIRNHDTRA